MQFQIPVVLLAIFLGASAAPTNNLEARFAIKGKATFSLADGTAAAGNNVNGCADVIKKGQATQLACVISQSGTGFTVRVTNLNTEVKQECTFKSNAGGNCGAIAVKTVISE